MESALFEIQLSETETVNVDEICFSHPLLPTQRRLLRGRESTVAIHGTPLPWTSADVPPEKWASLKLVFLLSVIREEE